MATVAEPLQNLAQRIHQREAELATLRKELAARQQQLAKLARRKEELHAQLEKVEAEMRSVAAHAVSAAAPMSAAAAKPASAAAATKTVAGASHQVLSLPKLLFHIVKQAKRPLSIKELVESVVRRNHPTTSKDLHAVVEARVGEMVRKGLLRRAAGDKPGITLGKASGSATAATVKPTPSKTHSTSGKKAAGKHAGRMTRQPSLRENISQVLGKSSRPLSTDELLDRILASGYQTKSKNFKNVLWVSISDMDNVEHLPGQGYRLRKRKTASSR